MYVFPFWGTCLSTRVTVTPSSLLCAASCKFLVRSLCYAPSPPSSQWACLHLVFIINNLDSRRSSRHSIHALNQSTLCFVLAALSFFSCSSKSSLMSNISYIPTNSWIFSLMASSIVWNHLMPNYPPFSSIPSSTVGVSTSQTAHLIMLRLGTQDLLPPFPH